MGIIFKVIDQNIKETVGESYLVPIKKFMTAEYANLTIELYHETRLAGKVYIETSFKVFKIFSEPKPQKLHFSQPIPPELSDENDKLRFQFKNAEITITENYLTNIDP